MSASLERELPFGARHDRAQGAVFAHPGQFQVELRDDLAGVRGPRIDGEVERQRHRRLGREFDLAQGLVGGDIGLDLMLRDQLVLQLNNWLER